MQETHSYTQNNKYFLKYLLLDMVVHTFSLLRQSRWITELKASLDSIPSSNSSVPIGRPCLKNNNKINSSSISWENFWFFLFPRETSLFPYLSSQGFLKELEFHFLDTHWHTYEFSIYQLYVNCSENHISRLDLFWELSIFIPTCPVHLIFL